MNEENEFWKDAPNPDDFPSGDELDSKSEQDKLPADSFDEKQATEEEH